jgi:hypothetical protein
VTFIEAAEAREMSENQKEMLKISYKMLMSSVAIVIGATTLVALGAVSAHRALKNALAKPVPTQPGNTRIRHR